MKLETPRRLLLAALAVLMFQGSSAREAIAKRAGYDAALERAYEWSKQTHAAEERAMGDLTLEARDLLRHPPEAAGPFTPGEPDSAAVARSAPAGGEASHPEPPSQATPTTAEDPAAPSRVATWWKRIRALRSGEPEPVGEFAKPAVPEPAAEKPGLGARLWAWINEPSSPDEESNETEEPATEHASPWFGAHLWAWLKEVPAAGVDGEETLSPTPDDRAPWLGARLWAWINEPSSPDEESDETEEPATEHASPWFGAHLWAWLKEVPAAGVDGEETLSPTPDDRAPWLGARLWAWLNAEPSAGPDTEEISAPTDGNESAWPGSRLWAWLTERQSSDEESSEQVADGEAAWPGARLWARLAALFAGSDAPHTVGPTQVAVLEAPLEPEPAAAPSVETTLKSSVGDESAEPAALPSVEGTLKSSVGNESAEPIPRRDSSANGVTTQTRAKTMPKTRAAPRTPVALARSDPHRPPPGPTTATKREPATVAQPSTPSAAGRDEPAIAKLRPMGNESGTADPSLPTAEPARIAKRSAANRKEPAREAKATPRPAKTTRRPAPAPHVRAAADTEPRAGVGVRRARAPEPSQPAPRRSKPAHAPALVARAAPPPEPPVRVAEPPLRVSSRAEARDDIVARTEPPPREEPHAPKPRTAVRFPPPLPEPTEHWRKRGRTLARQELARVLAALQRDGRATPELDPLRVAIDILRAEERAARASAW